MSELDEKTVNITTKCKDCIFAVVENNLQIGCKYWLNMKTDYEHSL